MEIIENRERVERSIDFMISNAGNVIRITSASGERSCGLLLRSRFFCVVVVGTAQRAIASGDTAPNNNYTKTQLHTVLLSSINALSKE